jgi:hypothetical protein
MDAAEIELERTLEHDATVPTEIRIGEPRTPPATAVPESLRNEARTPPAPPLRPMPSIGMSWTVQLPSGCRLTLVTTTDPSKLPLTERSFLLDLLAQLASDVP